MGLTLKVVYYYSFYRLFLVLQMRTSARYSYLLSIVVMALLKVWLLQCLIGTLTIIFGSTNIGEYFMPSSLIASTIFASWLSYVGLYRKETGKKSITFFNRWPESLLNYLSLVVAGLSLLAIADVIIVVEYLGLN